MGYRAKRLQDFARAMRETKAMVQREPWPRERLEACQRERLTDLLEHLEGVETDALYLGRVSALPEASSRWSLQSARKSDLTGRESRFGR